jgi:phosphopantetheinyl transferase
MPIICKHIFEKSDLYIWEITENVVEIEKQMYNKLTVFDKEKYNKITSQNRKKEWLVVRCLVNIILPEEESFIFYSESGNPYLKNYSIGISHTNNFVSVLISKTENVAVDIQEITKKTIEIKDKFLSEEEIKAFDVENQIVTTLLWTIKETVFKWYGHKNLPFAEMINILPFSVENQGLVKVCLKKNIILNVLYSVTEKYCISFINSNL